MTAGPRSGTNFLLDPTDRNRIGRGTDCDVILVDPLCSRVHVEVAREEDGWWVRDASSRNGTYINGQRVERAKLEAGSSIRVGSTEFVFHWSDQPPTMSAKRESTETIVREAAFDAGETNVLTSIRSVDESPQELMELYQLSLKLLSCHDPDQVVQHALTLLHQRTQASVVGFLWKSDDEQLKPKLVIPPQAASRVSLSQMLTELVCRRSRAVWVANQPTPAAPADYSDAICVPLIHQRTTLGAIHLYRKEGSFRQPDFDFSISLAGLLALGLVRARQQATLQAEHERLMNSSASFDELVGESEVMCDLKSRISRIARATGCVLIRGESGSGKELVARALHRASARFDRPLLSVNCAAIPPELIESQLFGHIKGAFTSADSDHQGWFQQADSGTLFLDEIGELPLVGQAKLLRILEGHPFLPVGATREVNVDVRVIAATNRDLRDLVKRRQFREDLFYRLSVFEIEVPPLRQRGADVGVLVDFFVDHFRKQHGRPLLRLSDEAREKLLDYRWPGNVRQMRNVIDSAVVMTEGSVIELDQLGLHEVPTEAFDSLRISDWEQRLIRKALERTDGKVPEAAKLLGLGRATLYRKLEEYGIER